MKKVPLEISAISHSVTQSQNYAVLLAEKNGTRRLPIVIGGYEAQSIAVAWERLHSGRPLTHDLFKNTLETFNITLKEVIISNLLDGVFYARLICVQDNNVYEIDSRTSDALALAVRFACPISTYEFILDAAGIVLEENDIANAPAARETPRRSTNTLAQLSMDELNRMLDDVIAQEDYEQAARIRDEIQKRHRS